MAEAAFRVRTLPGLFRFSSSSCLWPRARTLRLLGPSEWNLLHQSASPLANCTDSIGEHCPPARAQPVAAAAALALLLPPRFLPPTPWMALPLRRRRRRRRLYCADVWIRLVTSTTLCSPLLLLSRFPFCMQSVRQMRSHLHPTTSSTTNASSLTDAVTTTSTTTAAVTKTKPQNVAHYSFTLFIHRIASSGSGRKLTCWQLSSFDPPTTPSAQQQLPNKSIHQSNAGHIPRPQTAAHNQSIQV